MTASNRTTTAPGPLNPPRLARVVSIDALRCLVMFTMIFVNDLAGAPEKIVPWWLRHFPADGNGMTVADLVFPAFLFIVGMSIPLALGSRLNQHEPRWKTFLHIVTRTLSLLFIGILMVNGSPDSQQMGWPPALWSTLMFLSAILAFCSMTSAPRSDPSASRARIQRVVGLTLRGLGFAALLFLAFAFRGRDGHRIVTVSPFFISTRWYGILGLIGWAYLVAGMVFLLFRTQRTGLLGCFVLLMCLYPADRKGAFDHSWLSHYVGIGGTLGSQAAITVAGLLLASILVTPDTATTRSRARFALLFVTGCAASALLLHRLYGINKNAATPSWCLWACAITAALWLIFHFLCDLRPAGLVAKALAAAGGNVLLAYLLSEMLPSVIDLLHLGAWYGRLAEPGLLCAVARSTTCATGILVLTVLLNRAGFRLRL
jgi:predicted acyltransferase